MAPRATTKKPKALIFEAADSAAVSTNVAAGGVGCCAVEEQATSNSATYRATPIVAASALIGEPTTAGTTVTSRRKLKV